MSKKIIASIIGIAVVVVLIVAAGTYAFLSDTEISTGNQGTAWTSSLWTQTSQADFNAGVLNNADTSSSPGNVTIPSTGTSYVASGSAVGNWTNPANGYTSNNAYATYTPSATVTTKGPTANTGAAWTIPANANLSDTNYATIASGAPSGNNIWGNYGFILTGDPITKVRAGYSAFTNGSTITYQGSTTATAASGNVTTLTLPTNWAANDIWICFVVSLDNVTSTMPATWTAIGTGTNNGTGLRTTLYYRRAVAGDTAPTITHAGGSQITAAIIGYRGCIISDSPFDVNKAAFVKTPKSTVNDFGAGVTTTTNNDMIVLLSGTDGQQASSGFSGSPTPTGRLDGPNTAGYGRAVVADFTLATAGATGARTVTLAGKELNNGYQLSLKPAIDYPQSRVDVSWDGGTTWSSKQVTTLTQTKTTYYYDVTSAVAWDATKLNDTNLKVRVDVQTVGTVMTTSLDYLPVEVTYYDATLWSQNYSTYGINLTGDLISKVEVGFEAFAASSEKIQVEVSWNGGTTWSSKQASSALGSSDPNSTTWFDFTSATSWTPITLNNTNLQVRIWYLNNGAFGQVSLDYIPIRVTYVNPSGTLASQVFDTTAGGTRWDGIVWDSTVPANTTLTFEVRASDTIFTASDITLAWNSVGASPVLSLPSLARNGRYLQWRATLTTTVTTAMPVLSAVRTYYYHG